MQTQLKRITFSLVAALALIASPVHANPELEEIEKISTFLNVMNEFYSLIDSVHKVSSEPERAAIIQLHKIMEAYEESGNKARAEPVLRKVLVDTNNATIRAATYLMLGDLLKETGRGQEAIKVLQQGIDESLRNAR